MARFTLHCWKCGEVIETDAVFRSDTCLKCGEDVKVCMSCRHYDASVSNQCRETSAEYVHVKTRANYCTYYEPRTDRVEVSDEVQDAKSKLEALFGKKS